MGEEDEKSALLHLEQLRKVPRVEINNKDKETGRKVGTPEQHPPTGAGTVATVTLSCQESTCVAFLFSPLPSNRLSFPFFFFSVGMMEKKSKKKKAAFASFCLNSFLPFGAADSIRRRAKINNGIVAMPETRGGEARTRAVKNVPVMRRSGENNEKKRR